MSRRSIVACFLLITSSFAAQAGPVPLEIGEYKTAADDTCFGMSYWSNRAGSGMRDGEDGSPIGGWDCVADSYSHRGNDWVMRGMCSTGNGGHVPERRGSIRFKIIDGRTFTHAGKTYSWCGPGFSAR